MNHKILMVCLGNICRSPMAEGIFRHHAEKQGWSVSIDSAGTSGHHSGEAPDRRAINCLAKKNMDISNLRARRFVETDLERFDRIYVMDSSNMKDVLAMCRTEEEKSKVSYFLDVLPEGNPKYVPDPWYGDERDFEYVFDLLNEATILHLSHMSHGHEKR